MSFSKLIVAIVWLAVAGRTRGKDDVRCHTGYHMNHECDESTCHVTTSFAP